MNNETTASVGAVSGALTVVAVWGAGLAGVVVPPEVAAAVTVVVTAVVQLVSNRV